MTATTELSEPAAAASPSRLAAAYERFVPRLQALAYGLTGDREVARDLAQEAFVRVAGRLAYLRDPSAFEAYCRRTVVNLARANFRHQGVERRFLRRHAERPAPPQPPQADSADERAVIWAAVQSLPYRQRAAVVLRYYEDLSEHDTAAILRCSRKAVNSLVQRAMEALRPQLETE